METREVVIVGAGAAGLATGALLRRAGGEPLVLEAGPEPGAAWRARYDRLHLHTPRLLSGLPERRIPRRYGRWVARDDVIAYLQDYAKAERLDVRTGTAVGRIDPDGDGWLLALPDGPLRAGTVIVATGYNGAPWVPDWPGRDGFPGELVHSSEYRNPEPYRGRDVLVVGAGNSGAEIATDLAEGGASSSRLSVRTPPHIVFRQQNGIANPVLGVLFRHLPVPVFDAIARQLRKLTVGDLAEFGLETPTEGLYKRVQRDGAIPLVDMGFLEALKAGKVSIVAAVVGFEGDRVLLADGETLVVDAVIAATGYQRALAPLVGHLGVLTAEGRPAVRGRHTGTGAPNLWFTGFTNPVSGAFREAGIDAKRIARAVLRERRSGVVDALRVTAPRVVPGREPVRR